MSHHARIEEVSDSDPDDMDPSDFDPPFNQQSIISPANIPAPAAPSPVPAQAPTRPPQPPQQEQKREIPKHFQCLYPVYFDSSRSRAEGRKVGKEYAVENPLARDIVDAVQMAGLNVAFEPEKVHPKDWANPGRVRVHLRENGKLQNLKIKNKHHLYIIVGKYLRAHPTTEDSPFRLRIRGLPMPEKPIPAPPAPRGWKIGTILPFHSPAITGGGISDNPIKEAMMEMQGMPGMPGMPGQEGLTDTPNNGEGKKKKDKKKGKA